MKPKNHIFFLWIFLIIVACGTNDGDNKITIGFSQCIGEDQWRKEMNHSMQVSASLYPEIDLTIKIADRNIETQIAQIEEMIKKPMDIIIISPLESQAITPVVEKAYLKGIPVILIDRKIESQKYTAYLGADNIEVGRIAGNFLVSSSKGDVNVVEIKAEFTSSPGVERSLGFRQIIDQFPKVNLIKSLDVENFGLPALKFEEVLDSFPSINYVFAFNDVIALQAWEIAKRKGVEKQIKFIGVDGLDGPDGGIQSVKNGILTATILYPTGGSEAIKLAMRIAKGEINISKNNKLNTTLINSLNAEIMSNQFKKIDEQQSNIEEQQKIIKGQEEEFTTQNSLINLLVLLLIIVLSLTIIVFYSLANISKKKKELELNNQKITIQRNQIQKIANEVKISNEAKFNFFTGLSHEFKTPITLILSSIESMSENEKIKEAKLTNEVELLYSNSLRLLRLINQLLDFRKMEDRKFILRASNTNLYAFSNKIMKDFKRIAQKRNIEFNLTTNNENLELLLDRNLMDKVYFNILSNAFKFTPNNGNISIDIIDDFDTNFTKIHFKDSGIGIPSDEINKLFKPFFQASNNKKYSSGIGLHLAKEFVKLHRGSIEAKSKYGAEFTITMYKGNAHISEDEIIKEEDIVDSTTINYIADYESDDFNIEKRNTHKERFSVLIIEDNPDLVSFLEGKLSLEYEIHASDGTDGVEQAFELIPDIIICDINLPDKDGFEISELLKKDLRTSHIPIIILTVLNDKESYMKGLQAGVDLYLTKPFSLAILKQSIKGMLYNRAKLRYYFVNNLDKINKKTGFENKDQEFIVRINSIIEENIEEDGFNVESLAGLLFISRVQLYRKMKAILGVSINDYIQDFKLQHAKNLLNNTSFNISEIAYKSGFSSPGYFSTVFKNKYGISPKEFRLTSTI